MPANKTPAKNAKAGRTTARKARAKTSTAKSTTVRKAIVKKGTVKKTAAKRAASSMPARRGDLIVIDSAQVGSPPREGEITKVIHGELSVSYWVKWGDGHETLISPAAGTAHIVRT